MGKDVEKSLHSWKYFNFYYAFLWWWQNYSEHFYKEKSLPQILLFYQSLFSFSVFLVIFYSELFLMGELLTGLNHEQNTYLLWPQFSLLLDGDCMSFYKIVVN